MSDLTKLLNANLIYTALGTWFGAHFDLLLKNYVYDDTGEVFTGMCHYFEYKESTFELESIINGRDRMIQYAQLNVRYHASWSSMNYM